jgi:phage tail-like protein
MARSAISDPLEKFRFIVQWSATSEATVLSRAGFHDIQMPKRTTTKIHYREGVDPDISAVSPGLNTMEDIVMSRGLVIQDQNNELYKWMSAVHSPTAGSPGALPGASSRVAHAAADNFRKDVTIQMLDREGNVARQWQLFNAWPVHFVSGSDLNAGEDADKSLESLTLAYEDFQEQVVSTTSAVAPSSSL